MTPPPDRIGWAWWTYRLNGTNPNTHGIPGAPDGRQVKPRWRDLVNGYLAA